MGRQESIQNEFPIWQFSFAVMMLALTSVATVIFTAAYLRGSNLSGHIALLSGYLACNCFAGVRTLYNEHLADATNTGFSSHH